ncbi:hypothetical protein Taro_053585 [Colocasia esculenta]|uniref:Uncharacterized protein n=1 Tax=Colocasia esculenta TaxID=4460 RepID=A0A843XN19_COLES|nr:hypothetical protein [Colocasia esculenta]
MPDVIPGIASVTRGTGFRLAWDRGDAFKGGGCCGVPDGGFSGDLDFRRSVQRGNHARTMLGVWACRRRGGFGVLWHLLLVLADFGVVM